MVGRDRGGSKMIREALEGSRRFVLRDLVGADEWPAAVWPTSPRLREKAVKLGFGAATRAAPPGELLLVAARPGEEVGSLWRLRPDANARSAHFVGDAAASLALARRVTLRDLSILTGLTRRAPKWCAEKVVNTDDERALLGTSFGLAMCLGHASSMLGLTVPANVLASAEVRSDGTLVPVGYLPAKVACLVEHALGVTRLLVASEQVDEARGLLAKYAGALHGRGVEVVGAPSVRDAFRIVFNDIEDVLLARWRNDVVTARAAVEDLWRATVLKRSNLLTWKGVQLAASRLKETLSMEDPSAARRAEIVAKVAGRHQNQRGILLDYPSEEELERMSRPIRTEYLAHVVQSAADHEADVERAREYVARIKGRAPEPAECHAEDLKLRGAMGRAMARYKTAAECERWQRDTVEGWFAIDHGHEASYALSAWLNVCEDRDIEVPVGAVDDLVRRFDDDPRAEGLSRAHTRLAAARMFVLRGDGGLALHWLDPGEGFNIEDYLPGEALRWRARAHDIAMRPDAADAAREQLKALVRLRADAWDQAHLADLDAALRDRVSARWTGAIKALIEIGGEGTRLQVELGTDPARELSCEAATEFRDRYRY